MHAVATMAESRDQTNCGSPSQLRPIRGQMWPKLAEHGLAFVDTDQQLPRLLASEPTLVELVLTWTKCCRLRANFGQVRLGVGQTWASSAECGPTLAKYDLHAENSGSPLSKR